MADEDYEHVYKIILLGDATVGKSHLLCQYIKGSLPVQAKATIGVEFATRTVPLATGGSVKAQIWDTAGQERYRSITSAHYRRAVGALLVYDVSNRSSFYNCKKWLDELRTSSYEDIVIALIANKVDLLPGQASNDRCYLNGDSSDSAMHGVDFVLYDEGLRFANENNLHFFEASAVTGYNVKEVFEYLIQQVYNLKSRLPNGNVTSLTSFNSMITTSLNDKSGISRINSSNSRKDKLSQMGCLDNSCLSGVCNIQ
ncbi:GTPase [Theileria orientalis]|uniref:GTPase n=1 Tax=Theileria orientalis TaxID=68886 RepID=A0A976M8E5_THEOR|nr:GTPase [Theileria orientalis]